MVSRHLFHRQLRFMFSCFQSTEVEMIAFLSLVFIVHIKISKCLWFAGVNLFANEDDDVEPSDEEEDNVHFEQEIQR